MSWVFSARLQGWRCTSGRVSHSGPATPVPMVLMTCGGRPQMVTSKPRSLMVTGNRRRASRAAAFG
eukprot:338441-Lingulodinium_polyedra.AAC.1